MKQNIKMDSTVVQWVLLPAHSSLKILKKKRLKMLHWLGPVLHNYWLKATGIEIVGGKLDVYMFFSIIQCFHTNNHFLLLCVSLPAGLPSKKDLGDW